MSDTQPVDAASRTFRVAFRGYDQAEVRQHLEELEGRLRQLQADKDALRARLEQVAGREYDFDALSHEIGQILTAAKDAADGLRARATDDVTRWRAEAEAETRQQRMSAAEDAEAMRTDAWTTSTTMLSQAEALRSEMLTKAEREALAITGQSERDSHRMLANARREADEQLRLAKMEAERMLAEARAEQESIVETARKTAETAQERARALEVRRAEMLEELESVRMTVAKLESDLEEKREALEQTAPEPADGGSVRVVEGADAGRPDEPEPWGEDAIRIIPAQKKPKPDQQVDAALMAEEVRRLREQDEPEDGAVAEPVDDTDEALEETADDDTAELAETTVTEASPGAVGGGEEDLAGTTPEEAASGEPFAEPSLAPIAPDTGAGETDDALEGLFARLRNGGSVEEAEVPAPVADEADAPKGAPAHEEQNGWEPLQLPESVDPTTLRDQLILPIANRILRSVKRQLTEAQNIALEEIRVSEGAWEPSVGSLAADLRGDLLILAQESFAAGYIAVETMTGAAPGRAKPAGSDIVEHSTEFAGALQESLEHHVSGVEGARPLNKAVSRTFRVWRTDEAERRVRGYARAAYHRGISRALTTVGISRMFWLVAGRGCPDCRTMLEHGPVRPGVGFGDDGVVPPLHDGCGCTIVPGG